MINIIKKLVQQYIPKLTIKDLETFAHKNNIEYTQEELLIIYQFIKYNYQELLDQNIKVFEHLKEKISKNLYKQLLSLYIDYKQKYL